MKTPRSSKAVNRNMQHTKPVSRKASAEDASRIEKAMMALRAGFRRRLRPS